MGRRKKEPRPCIFCKGLVTGEGEHIIQRRLLRAWAEEPDGRKFTLEHPHGKATSPDPYQLMIDVCPDCNSILNKLFDTPATEPSKTLLDREGTLYDADVEALARWIIKTIVLWYHPRSYWKFLAKRYPKREPVNRWSLPNEALIPFRDGSIPEGIELWAVTVDRATPVLELPEPWASTAVKASHGFVEFGAGHGKAQRSVLFHLRYRAGTTRDPFSVSGNPFEDTGAVTRLWPAPPAQLSVDSLPAMNPETATEYVRRFPGIARAKKTEKKEAVVPGESVAIQAEDEARSDDATC